MSIEPSRVLVTGALGWLGRNLINGLVRGLPECDLLSKPNTHLKIRAFDLKGLDFEPLRGISEGVEPFPGDICDKKDCEQFCSGAKGTTLFHTIGIIHPKRVRDFYKINLRGTRNIIEAAIKAKVKRVIVVSSNSPCGCNPNQGHRFDETSDYNPYMHYGRSKMQMEILAQEHQKAGKIEIVIIRPTWLYGPFQPARQGLFFKMIQEGKVPIVGKGENQRSLSYTENLVQGLLLAAMNEKANGEIYWIADEQPYSMNAIIDTIEALLEGEFKQRCARKRMRLPNIASEVARVSDKILQSVGLYHSKIHVLSEMNKTIACSIEKAKNELSYNPTVSLEEGMRRSLSYWLQNQ